MDSKISDIVYKITKLNASNTKECREYLALFLSKNGIVGVESLSTKDLIAIAATLSDINEDLLQSKVYLSLFDCDGEIVSNELVSTKIEHQPVEINFTNPKHYKLVESLRVECVKRSNTLVLHSKPNEIHFLQSSKMFFIYSCLEIVNYELIGKIIIPQTSVVYSKRKKIYEQLKSDKILNINEKNVIKEVDVKKILYFLKIMLEI